MLEPFPISHGGVVSCAASNSATRSRAGCSSVTVGLLLLGPSARQPTQIALSCRLPVRNANDDIAVVANVAEDGVAQPDPFRFNLRIAHERMMPEPRAPRLVSGQHITIARRSKQFWAFHRRSRRPREPPHAAYVDGLLLALEHDHLGHADRSGK
jgi:hypothetical protein